MNMICLYSVQNSFQAGRRPARKLVRQFGRIVKFYIMLRETLLLTSGPRCGEKKQATESKEFQYIVKFSQQQNSLSVIW